MHWWNWGGKAKIKSKYLSYFDVAKLYYKHPTFPLQQQQKKKAVALCHNSDKRTY